MKLNLLALAFALTAVPAFAAETSAILAEQQGVVMVNQGEVFETAVDAQALKAGDRIMVMEGASAVLTFADGCSLAVESGSMLVVPELSPCAGAVADVHRIGATYAQTTSVDTSDGDMTEWLIAAGVVVAVGLIVAENDDDDDSDSP